MQNVGFLMTGLKYTFMNKHTFAHDYCAIYEGLVDEVGHSLSLAHVFEFSHAKFGNRRRRIQPTAFGFTDN